MISIVVPIYNVEAYLEKCIDSLINQTFMNLEIILVNDGSTDKSGQICDLYKDKDNRIKVIHKKNGGLSDARNKGIEVASGKYIAFLDSDDWVELDIYEKLYNYLIIEDADIVQCGYEKVYDDNSIIDRNIKEEINICEGKSILYNFYGEQSVKNTVVWNKIYKKDLFDNIKFPNGKYHEDEFTTYKVIHKAKKIVDINIPLVYYRQRKNSIMNSKFNIKRLDAIEAFEERIKYCNKNNLFELKKRTEERLFYILENIYIDIINSNICDKNKIVNKLREKARVNYLIFIKNNYINIKSKILISIFILNKGIYKRIINRKQYLKENS